jgi:hypothetical protein
VWLWETRGPERCVSGVSDDEARALHAAEVSLRRVGASEVLVEQAYPVLGTETLEYGYQRTGEGWHGCCTSGTRITWDRLTTASAAYALPPGR